MTCRTNPNNFDFPASSTFRNYYHSQSCPLTARLSQKRNQHGSVDRKTPIDDLGFVHVSVAVADALKEVQRRIELRLRLEAEQRRHLTDEEFLRIAEMPN